MAGALSPLCALKDIKTGKPFDNFNLEIKRPLGDLTKSSPEPMEPGCNTLTRLHQTDRSEHQPQQATPSWNQYHSQPVKQHPIVAAVSSPCPHRAQPSRGANAQARRAARSRIFITEEVR